MSRSVHVQHTYGAAGGYLVGRSHSRNGIKAINKANGQPIELEGGEAVITRNALADKTLHEFDGLKLTQRQILSRINQNGGGVSFDEGGEIPDESTCMCSGNVHLYNGKQMSDIEVFTEMAQTCGCSHHTKENNAHFSLFEEGGILSNELTEAEKKVIQLFKINPRGYISLYGYGNSDLPNLLKHDIVHSTGITQSGTIDIFLTGTGRGIIKKLILEEGGSIPKGLPEKMVMRSDKTAIKYQFLKNLKRNENRYQLNKAIDEFFNNKTDNVSELHIIVLKKR